MNISIKSIVLLFLLFGTAFTLGCGGAKRPDGMPKVFPCQLTITQGGQPVEGVNVELFRKGTDSFPWPVGGLTDASGIATLQTYGKYPGAPQGDFLVTVNKRIEEGTWPSDDKPGTTISRYSLVDLKLTQRKTTTLEISMPASAFSHTLEIGKATKILLEKIDPNKQND